MKTLRRILLIFILFFLSFICFAFGYYFTVTRGVRLRPEKLILSDKSILLYDGNGETITCTSADPFKQTVSLSQLSNNTKNAFVDTEDKRFYTHGGFDIKRIGKAVFNNLKSRSFKEGASTISQQLIKNTHLGQEKTLKRKLKEWKLTKKLEKTYEKDEILEKYLNVIYFGHNCFGIRSASNFYFGKQPSELDLADSAILAGLVKSPNNYSPFKNPENCKKRKNTVLSLMLKNGHITEEEKRTAMEKPLPTAPTTKYNAASYAHFVFDELSALSEEYGFTVGGNVEIYTYFDKNAQQALQNSVENFHESDFALSVLDVETGGFKACLSSVGEIRRLPGSVLKPLLVYAPALEKDVVSPATPILDEKINYAGYSPENYDKTYHGYVSVRESLSKSFNVPAVKLLETVGVQNAVSYLSRMQLPIEREDYSLALALGGMKHGFSLNQLTSAYATLANGGQFQQGAFISKVLINEQPVYTRKQSKTRVFSEETAYLTTDMLRTAVKTGTAKKLRNLPFAIVAKTGTVGTQKGNTDAYAISYTSRDVVGVWLGNKDNSFISSTGGGTPCNLSYQINEQLFNGYKNNNLPLTEFLQPSGILRVALDKTSYYDTHTLLLADKNSPIEYTLYELFKKSAIPTKTSDLFTKPSIIPPKLEYKDNQVTLTFNEKSPNFYEYKIEKYDYVTHSLLYQGEYLKTFIDKAVQKNKRYIYTVTPIYKGIAGTPISLPIVNTNALESPPIENDGIKEKNWWDY